MLNLLHRILNAAPTAHMNASSVLLDAEKELEELESAIEGQCGAAMVLVLVCGALALVLLVHHKIKHSRPGPNYIADPCEQWFQYRLYPHGDVCNWRTCNHEMWILLLLATSLGTSVFVAINGC